VNWHANPINLGFAIRTNALSSNWQIDVTMDDILDWRQRHRDGFAGWDRLGAAGLMVEWCATS
jgi:hypothetical protein